MNTISIYDIERKAQNGSRFFFSPDTMRFFLSRKPSYGFQCENGGVYFVTSEQFRDHRGSTQPRAYTVRYMDLGGNIDTVNTDGTLGTCSPDFGGFQAYSTSKRAQTAARKWAEANHVPAREWNWNGSEMVRSPLELAQEGGV